MADKVPTIEEYNRENIFLKNELTQICEMALRLSEELKTHGDINLATKIEHIAIKAMRTKNGPTNPRKTNEKSKA